MPVIPFPQRIHEKLGELECLLVEIEAISETLELIDQVPPSGRQRRLWENCIVMLHGYVARNAAKATELCEDLRT